MNFLMFIGSEFVSSIGNGAYRVALNWTLLLRYGTLRALAMVQFLSLLFGAVVQMLSGGLIDRYDGRQVLIATNLMLGGVAGVLALDAAVRPTEFSTGIALICVVMISAVGATVEPAFFSAVARVHGRPANDAANSWILGTYALSGILGPVLGGILTLVRGAFLAFAVDAISFVFAGVLMSLVTLEPQDEWRRETETHSQNPWYWTWHTPVVRRIFTVEAFANLAITIFILGLPLIAREKNLAGGSVGLGMLYGAFYAGVFLASAVVPQVAEKHCW